MNTKECFKCNAVKPLEEFYKHPKMADGHLGKCKECSKRDVRANRANRREYYSKYDQERRQRPERRRYTVKQRALYKQRNPEKAKAHNLTQAAVHNGTLIRQPCERQPCEKTAQAHHDDYSRPLEVRWLCFRHHREHHGQTPTVF